MKSRLQAFNIILCGVLAGASGCSTVPTYDSKEESPDKQLTVLRLHIQTSGEASRETQQVPIFRARPVLVTVDSTPFITEANVIAAEVVDEASGFSIQVEFDREGRWLLEKVTGDNLRRHLAVFASFGPDRWLGAPEITKVISDGKFAFTPDATRDEAVRIVRGLKNYAKKMDHDPRF